MTQKAYVIAQALVTYGHFVNNHELVHLVEHKPSVWDRFASNLAKEKVEQVLQAAQLRSAELTNYGIQSEHLSELVGHSLRYAGHQSDYRNCAGWSAARGPGTQSRARSIYAARLFPGSGE